MERKIVIVMWKWGGGEREDGNQAGGCGQAVKNRATGGRPLLQLFNVPPTGNNQLSETPEGDWVLVDYEVEIGLLLFVYI